MLKKNNPFKPGIGSTPPVLAGRGDAIEDFTDSLEEEPGGLERVTLLYGFRGVGKTALLTELGDRSRTQGWHVCDVTAGTPGFMDEIREFALARAAELGGTDLKVRLESFQLFKAKFRLDDESAPVAGPTLREALTALLDVQQEFDAAVHQDPVGLLVTVDEIHRSNRDEIREFAAVVQHLIREERNIAVVMAGLPSSIQALVEDKEHDNPATFIRKADKVQLGNISDEDVQDALVLPLQRLGIRWNDDALDLAVEGSSGYPFMVQLVGSYIYRASVKRSDDDEITREDATTGVAKARRKIGALVNGPAFEDLSETDRSVLVAMSIDDGDTSVADLRERLELADNPAGRQYVNTYRKRLIDAGVVEEHGRGRLRFTMPFMREYLREHFSSDIIDNR